MNVKSENSDPSVLVFLHGWGQSREALVSMASLFEGEYRVYTLDLPGFGKEAAPAGVWSSFDYADFVIEKMRSMGVDAFSVLGHSFGGKVAMSLAVRYPQQINSLVLLATSGLKRKRSFFASVTFFTKRALGLSLKKLDTLFHTSTYTSYFIPRFGSRDYLAAGNMRAILVKTVMEDISSHLPTIKAPTLIVWGADDQETPLEMAHRLHKQIANSSLCILPFKDHYLFDGCGAHLCAYHILPFLRSHG